MRKAKAPGRQISLQRKVAGWFAAITALTVLTVVATIALGQTILEGFDGLIQDNLICYRVQAAIEKEKETFDAYVREASQENWRSYNAACTQTQRCIEALPRDCEVIGQERFARTWNLVQGYEGYREYRDGVIRLDPEDADYMDRVYQVYKMQEYLALFALRLVQATMESGNAAYSARAAQFQYLPLTVLGLLVVSTVALAMIMRLISVTVVEPTLAMAQQARRIGANDFSGPDLTAKGSSEMTDLVREFNRMKHATADYISTQEALHREEVSKLELERSLNHARLEMLKSQVNPHFLFNTLNMISCMARLEDAGTTDRMILALSGLFRYNLRTKAQVVYLEQELEALEDYVYIQQMRFDNRLTYRSILRVDPGRVKIPSFTLQPVVENAFVHGLAAREEDWRITLRVWQEGEDLMVSIADNGRGMTEAELQELTRRIHSSEQTSRGIGLGNIARRIDMMYTGGSTRIYSRPGRGTVVQFTIPQTKKEG